MKIYTTCENFKAAKKMKGWKIELFIDDSLVPDEWKKNPWSLIEEGFDIEHKEHMEE